MRKPLTLTLLVLFLITAVISVIIGIRLLQNLAPGDSSAGIGDCTLITFDNLSTGAGTTEDLVISNQFLSEGYSFRTGPRFDGSACDRPYPFIAKQGDPFRSFGNNTLNQSDMPAAGETFGPSWLTSQSYDGTEDQRNRPCALDIVFPTQKTDEFSFDILDLDYGERWNVKGFADDGDTNPIVNISVVAQNNASGDGRARHVTVTSPTPVALIRIEPAILEKADGGSWGLGFDNFAAFCADPSSSTSTTTSVIASSTVMSSAQPSSASTTSISSSSISSSITSSSSSTATTIITSSAPTSSSNPGLPDTAIIDEQPGVIILIGLALISFGILVNRLDILRIANLYPETDTSYTKFERKVLRKSKSDRTL